MKYENLKKVIETTKIIDDHAHIDMEGAAAYLKGIGCDPRGVWAVTDNYDSPLQSLTSGWKYLQDLHYEAFEKIYGFSRADLDNPEKAAELQAKYREIRNADYKKYLTKIMDEAGVEEVFGAWNLPKNLLHDDKVKYVPSIDFTLFPFNNSGALIPDAPLKGMNIFVYYQSLWVSGKLAEKYPGFPGKSFAEYCGYLDKILEELKAFGIVSYKFISTYVRSCDYGEWRPLEEIEKDWEPAKNGDWQAYYRLQGSIMWHIVEKAVQLDMPIQYHTALVSGYIDNTNVSAFQVFLHRNETAAAKIVMLHAGYPSHEKAIPVALASVVGMPNNMIIELSGRIMFAQPATIIAKQLKTYFAHPGLWGKLIYGSDAINRDRVIYTAARTIRDALYMALSDMLDDGTLTEVQAITIAKNVLRNNAIRTYNLPLELA